MTSASSISPQPSFQQADLEDDVIYDSGIDTFKPMKWQTSQHSTCQKATYIALAMLLGAGALAGIVFGVPVIAAAMPLYGQILATLGGAALAALIAKVSMRCYENRQTAKLFNFENVTPKSQQNASESTTTLDIHKTNKKKKKHKMTNKNTTTNMNKSKRGGANTSKIIQRAHDPSI